MMILIKNFLVKIANLSRRRRLSVLRGQGLLEFALVIPIFMLLVLGVLEFGRYMTALITINTSSREAARYGSAVGDNGSGVPFYQDCPGIVHAASRFSMFAQVNGIDIRYDKGPDDPTAWESLPTCSPSLRVGLADRIIVKVTGQYNPVIMFTNLTFPLESTTSRTIVTKLDIRSTQYVMDTPEPEETPHPGYCEYITTSPIIREDLVTYSYVIRNDHDDFHAILDEIVVTHTKAGPSKYFANITILDASDPLNEVVLYTENYESPAETNVFTLLPYNLALVDQYGNWLGVPPGGTLRIRFSFSQQTMSYNGVITRFYNVDCPKTLK